jgi:hypothetical protein
VTRTSSRVVVLFLVAALVALPSFAATHAPQTKTPGLMSVIVQLLHQLFPGLEKAQGTMDPDGKPAPSSTITPTSDAHGTMDPDGHA